MTWVSDSLARLPRQLDVTGKIAALPGRFHIAPGPLVLTQQIPAADAATDGLFQRNPSAWNGDEEAHKVIVNRLGWLTSPLLMADALPRLQEFGDAVLRDGFSHVVLLGMGGSSLAPEVLRAVLGSASGAPALHVLDSTDPAAVRAAATPPDCTLYLLASKSGTTIEPNSLAAHFRGVLQSAGITAWAQHFVAITDEGTELARLARAERFRDVFINPTDIGGRYSALSYFGLVPAAVLGLDLAALVGWGAAMIAASEPGPGGAVVNPAAGLGLFMGAATLAGRDKLTLLLPEVLEPFGLWVEQLVAESTGKMGVGVVPIAGETLGPAEVYSNDRAFVRIRLNGSGDDDAVARLASAGFPVATIDLPDPLALGAEFVRWEVATAVAGALLRINPFDEPNVQQAKDATRKLLDEYKASGRLPTPAADETAADCSLTLSSAARQALAGRGPDAFLTLLAAGDYLAMLAYVGPDAGFANVFHQFRSAVRDRSRTATMFGYGPRYLHSTGQLHKGGANSGVFVLVTAAPSADLPIPGEGFTFGTLEFAQALGDFQSLDRLGRRALHVHLNAPDPHTLEQVFARLAAHVGPPRR